MIRLVWRAELRSRWASLIGLALLVAIVASVVLTAIVGARRTSSTLERFRDRTNSSDAGIQTTDPSGEQASTLLAALRSDPDVEGASPRYLVNGYPAGADPSTTDFAVMSDPEGHYGVDVDRMEMLSGRMPARDRPDEIVLTEQTATTLGLDVGDHVELKTFSGADLDAMSSGGFNGFNGPEMDLTVVGIGRTPDELQGDLVRNSLFALAGPTFIASHPGVGAWPPAVALRLKDPETGVERVQAQAERALGFRPDESSGLDVTESSELYVESTQRAITAASTGLIIFACVAGAAGLLVVGQGLSRQIASSTATADILRTLGADRIRRAIAVSTGAIAAGSAGLVMGVLGALALSPLLPTGLAERAEVDPGVWIDPVALALGTVVIGAFIVAVPVATAAHWSRRSAGAGRLLRGRTTAADLLARWGCPPALVIGVRRAFPRRSGLSVSARAATVAVVLAITGIIGTAAVVASLDGLTGDSARWGWNWTTMPEPGGDMDPGETTDIIGRHPGVEAMATLYQASFGVGGDKVDGFAIDQGTGRIQFTLAAGRMPATDAEVALSPNAMDNLAVTTGDVITAERQDGTNPTRLRVVGTVVVPITESEATGSGAVLTTATLTRLGPPQDLTETGTLTGAPVLRYAPDVDADQLERELAERAGMTFPAYARSQIPGSVNNVEQSRGIAIGLTIFLALLAVAGLVHSLVVTGRRGRSETAVFRAIGFRNSQLCAVVESHALSTIVVGLGVGIPLGLVVGQLVWRRLVDGIGVIDVPTVPWFALLAIVPVTIGIAAVVALPPGIAASRIKPADALRAD